MPKVYYLKGLMELLRLKEKQDARLAQPVDWALEATKDELREFFKGPLRGISGETVGMGSEGRPGMVWAGREGGVIPDSPEGVADESRVQGHSPRTTPPDTRGVRGEAKAETEGDSLEGLS